MKTYSKYRLTSNHALATTTLEDGHLRTTGYVTTVNGHVAVEANKCSTHQYTYFEFIHGGFMHTMTFEFYKSEREIIRAAFKFARDVVAGRVK